MAKWQTQHPINISAGGDTVYDGFVKVNNEYQAIYDRLNELRVVRAGATAPADAEQYELWLDTSVTPPKLRYYDGTWKDADELIPQGSGSGLDADKVDGFDASQVPQANQIPVLNASGQLSLPFNSTSILVSNQALMSRVFYVDAVNGNDANDGSQSAPFKTIQKAIDSVPVGGRGVIYLYPGTYTTANIVIRNKIIDIRSLGSGQTITITNAPAGGGTTGWYIRNSLVTIADEDIEIVTANQSGGGMFRGDVTSGALVLWGIRRILVQQDWLFNIYPSSALDIIIHDLRDTTNPPFQTLRQDNLIGNLFYGAVAKIRSPSPVINSTGANVTTSCIGGIIKDANGVPRNVISNLVL